MSLTQRTARHVAAALAVAALAAPTALAQDLRSPDTRDAAAAARQRAAVKLDLRSPDTRDAADAARMASVSSRTGDLRSPDTRDRATGRLEPTSTGTTVITIHRPGVFDWADAAIGAAGGAGVIFVLIATWLLVRQGRTAPRPA